MSKTTEIFTPAQRMTIKTKGAGWLKAKLGNASPKEIIEPFSFELITDSICWLRSGVISLCMIETKTNYRGEAFEIKVPHHKTRNEICKIIAGKLCRILINYLRESNKSKNSFNSVFKCKRRHWIAKAHQWLDEDIMAEEDWASCFKIKPFEGRKIIATTYKKHFALEVDLYFNTDGCIEVDKLTSNIAKRFEDSFGMQGILDNVKQDKIRPLVSSAATWAIHSKAFAYPYQKATKQQVFKIEKEIKMAAKTLGIPPLAVAGAFADLLEVDTTFKTKQYHDMLGEAIWRKAGKFVKKHDEKIGMLIDGAQYYAPASVPAAWANLIWSGTRPEYKKLAIESLSRDTYSLLTWLNRQCDIAATGNRDDFVGEQAKIDIQELSKNVKLLPDKLKRLKSEFKVAAIKEMPIKTLLAFRVYFYINEDERLLNKAMQIAPKLCNIYKAPEQRNRIYKWERFHRYFL